MEDHDLYEPDHNTKLLEEDMEQDVDMDTFINHAGAFSLYQILMVLLMSLTWIPVIYCIVIFYYIGHSPMWRCNPNKIASVDALCTNDTTLHDSTDNSRCQMNRSSWIYDNPNKTTTVTEFDLVCDRSWLNALSGSVVFIGWGIGIIVFGYLSDRFGRKRVMYPCLALTLLCLFLHAFATDIWMLIILRLVMGFFFSAPALNIFILMIEPVGCKYRVLATTIGSFAWTIGSPLLTYKAYKLDSWRTLCIYASVPYILTLFTAICVPESVRWLNTTGRGKEAEKILRKVARINRKVLPSTLSLQEMAISNVKKVSYIDLFKHCHIVKLNLSQGFIWFHAGLTAYAVMWEFADIGGDMYLNNILSCLVEIPGHFLILFTLQRFGRKRMNFLYSVIITVAMIAVACTPKTESMKTLRLTFGLLGKTFLVCLFNGIYIWSSEIYATAARSQGMAMHVVTARIGGACSPFIKMLYAIHPSAPFGLMATTSAISTVLCLTLPETLNQPTRETLDDMCPSVTVTADMMINGQDNHGQDNQSYFDNDNQVPPSHVVSGQTLSFVDDRECLLQEVGSLQLD